MVKIIEFRDVFSFCLTKGSRIVYARLFNATFLDQFLLRGSIISIPKFSKKSDNYSQYLLSIDTMNINPILLRNWCCLSIARDNRVVSSKEIFVQWLPQTNPHRNGLYFSVTKSRELFSAFSRSGSHNNRYNLY